MGTDTCYLCGYNSFRQREGCVRDNPELTINECLACGLVFLSSFDHVVAGFYEGSGMHGNAPLDIGAWIKETEGDDARRYEFIKRLLPGCSLLDFGCGTGNFLLKAAESARLVHGLEPEKRLRTHFEECGLTVFPTLADIPSGSRYDLITMFHVLEHLPDPLETLLHVKQLLKKTGRLVIEVPNADDALLTLYNSEAFSRFTYWSCHLFLFNAQTLETLCRNAGFRVEYIQQVQRYPLSNHLHWLAKEAPGGHSHWNFLDSEKLNAEYAATLGMLGKCDTLMAGLRRDS